MGGTAQPGDAQGPRRDRGLAGPWISDFWAPGLSGDMFLLFQTTFGIIYYSSHRKHAEL